MFGFSFAELVIIFLIAIIFIKADDLPEIAYFFGKSFYRLKKLISEVKSYFKQVEKDIGVDELKQEINRGIADVKSENEEDGVVIIDIYGNEHKVSEISKLRPELSEQEIIDEINSLNKKNTKAEDYTKTQIS